MAVGISNSSLSGVLFPVVRIVLGVCQNVADENLTSVQMNGNDEPELVSTDVEDRQASHLVGVRITGSEVGEVVPTAACDMLDPRPQR